MATSAIRRRTSPRRASFSATIRQWGLKKVYAAPSSGIKLCKPRQKRPRKRSHRPKFRPQNKKRVVSLTTSGLRRLPVAERFAGFRRVVVPEVQRFEFLLLRPNLIQRVTLEQ